MNLASELAKPRVSLRRRNELQTCTNSLSDATTRGSLRLFQKIRRDLDGYLARRFHDFKIPYSIPVFNMATTSPAVLPM